MRREQRKEGTLYKVWKVTSLQRQNNRDAAQAMLERVAREVSSLGRSSVRSCSAKPANELRLRLSTPPPLPGGAYHDEAQVASHLVGRVYAS